MILLGISTNRLRQHFQTLATFQPHDKPKMRFVKIARKLEWKTLQQIRSKQSPCEVLLVRFSCFHDTAFIKQHIEQSPWPAYRSRHISPSTVLLICYLHLVHSCYPSIPILLNNASLQTSEPGGLHFSII